MPSSKLIRDKLRSLHTNGRRRLAEELARSSPLFRTARGLTALQRSSDFARREGELIRDLSRAARTSQPIVVGPWVSEVGFEVLYWVPFLRWCVERFELDASRLIVLSRGGAHAWYAGLHARYVEVFDLVSPAEFKAQNEARVARTRLQKQVMVDDFERELLVRAGFDARSEFFWLHPGYMYRLFNPYWCLREPLAAVDKYTRHVPRARPSRPEQLGAEDYVAVKVYFNDSFPDTAENRAFTDALVRRLARRQRVVLLNTGFDLDDHAESAAGAGAAAIVDLSSHMRVGDNLDFQTRVVANARAFYGTYGGFSYIAPYYGVPSSAFHSAEEKASASHLDVAHLAVRRLTQALAAGSGGADFRGYVPSFVALSKAGFEALQQTL